MAATVTGTFTLIDRASSTLRRIEEQAQQTDRALAGVGDRIDDIGTRDQMRQHEELGRKLRTTSGNADVLNRRLDTTRSKTDAVGAAMGTAAVRGGAFGSVITVLGTALAALLPVIIDVGGALGALVGSLGRALKGMSALAVGGVGVLGVAIAGLAGTILPTITNLGKLSEAFNAVSEAQQKYGKGSKEARDAMKEMAQARKGMEDFDVARGMSVVRGFDTMRSEWTRMTSRGQSSVLQMIIDTMNTTRSMMPMLARNANEIAAATGGALRVFLDRINGPEFSRFVNTMTNVYEVVAKPLANTFANIGEALGNIAVAASGELERLAFTLERASGGWLSSTEDIGGMRSMIRDTSRETGDWYRLLKASWDWLVALFGPGADEGQGLVQAMTDKLNEQTRWFETNPAKMADFYRTSGDGVRRLARFLGDIGPTLMDISDAMRPVTQAFQELVNLLSEMKLGNISALTLGIAGLGIGRIGNLVRDLGGGRSLATGGLAALMGAGSMRGWLSGEGGRMGRGGRWRGMGPFELLAGAGGAMFGKGSPGMDSPGGYAGMGGIPAGVVPVFVVGGQGIGMGSPGRGGGVPVGAVPVPTGGLPAHGPARAPWYYRMFGGRMGPMMTTVGGGIAGARMGAANMAARAGAAPGILGGLARVGMGVGRFAGRAFLPLSLLFGLGDFLSTEGNVLNRLQGALSGATLGLIPAPKTEEQRQQEAMASLTDAEGFLQLNGDGSYGRGTRRADFRRERRAILEPYGRVGRGRRGARVSAAPMSPGNPRGQGRVGGASGGAISDEDQRRLAAIRDVESQFAGDQIVEAMSIRIGGGKAKRALTVATKQVFKEIRQTTNAEQARSVSEGAVAYAKAAARANPELKGQYEKLAQGVEKRLGDMGSNVAIVNGRIYEGSRDKWEKIRQALGSKAERAKQEVSNEFTQLQNMALGQLKTMGYTGKEARDLVSGADARGARGLPGGGSGGSSGGGGGGGGGGTRNPRTGITVPAGAHGMRIPGYAGGGRLAGQGYKDTVPLTLGMAAPGELVVNRHTEGRVDSMLGMFGTNLNKEVSNERVPHSGTPRPGRGPGKPHIFHAKGGRIGAGIPDAMGALPGLDLLAHFLKQKFGLSVTSGLRPGAMTSSGNPSDHGWGGAIDVSNGVTTPQMDAAHAWVQANLGPALKQVLYRTMVGGNHYDHIHIALTEAYARNPEALQRLLGGGGAIGGLVGGGGGPAPRINLRAGRTGQSGLPGAMAQRGMDMLAAGLEDSVNRRLGGGRGGRGGGGATVRGKATYFGGGMMASGLNTDINPGIALNPNPGGPDPGSWDNETTRRWLENRQRFRVTVGGKSAILPMLDKGPAGWTGNAIDVNMAGLTKMGFTTGTFPSGTVGTATALAKGGRVPFGGWYGDGGDFIADRPTLIGVGEKGKERVQVTPTGRSAGMGGVKIGNITINNHREGDIRKQIKKELGQAFSELEREIGNDTKGGVV